VVTAPSTVAAPPSDRRARPPSPGDEPLAGVLAAEHLAELMTGCASGDQQCFAELYDRTVRRVYGTVLRVLRSPEYAEEVTQEVYVEVWRQAPRYAAEKGSVMAWISTMAHRRAVDRVRSRTFVAHLSADNEVSPPGCPAGVQSGAHGVAVIQIDEATGEIRYRVVAANLPGTIASIPGAHIHIGVAGANGLVVLLLALTDLDTGLVAAGTAENRGLASLILADPGAITSTCTPRSAQVGRSGDSSGNHTSTWTVVPVAPMRSRDFGLPRRVIHRRNWRLHRSHRRRRSDEQGGEVPLITGRRRER
jgi:Sigma-70 region 2/CHRD domain